MRRILHISDLHFGRTDPVLIEAFLASVPALAADVVVVSGDLTQRATSAQFAAARAFLDRIAAEHVDAVRRHWAAAWRQRLPQARPEHAAALLAPLIALRQALVYQRFLDGIEDSEHPYHREDVPGCLRRAAERLRSERRESPSA